jgi:hypothetical protein
MVLGDNAKVLGENARVLRNRTRVLSNDTTVRWNVRKVLAGSGTRASQDRTAGRA